MPRRHPRSAEPGEPAESAPVSREPALPPPIPPQPISTAGRRPAARSRTIELRHHPLPNFTGRRKFTGAETLLRRGQCLLLRQEHRAVLAALHMYQQRVPLAAFQRATRVLDQTAAIVGTLHKHLRPSLMCVTLRASNSRARCSLDRTVPVAQPRIAAACS